MSLHPDNPAALAWHRLWRWMAVRAPGNWQTRLMFIAMLPWTGPVRDEQGRWRWSLWLWPRRAAWRDGEDGE
jgi:hypothetical protein